MKQDLKDALENLSDGVWAFIIAASEIEAYVGRIDPHTGEITIKHQDELSSHDVVIDRPKRS